MKLLIFLLAACGTVRSRYHVVETGETLAAVSKRYHVPLGELRSHNEHAPDELQAGTKLYIPFEDGDLWDPDFGWGSSRTWSRKPASLGSVGRFVWPVAGRVTSNFGYRNGRMHTGIDIAAPRGTAVRAARSGEVTYAGNRVSGYGNVVVIRHSDEMYSSLYAHLSKIHVTTGSFVNRGQLIGKVGQTGRAHGPHLHFEIRELSTPVNPLLHLQTQYAANIVGR